MDEIKILFYFYGAVGLILAFIGIILTAQKISRNNWIGFRTKKTMANENLWYTVNKVVGKNLLMGGIFISLVNFILYSEKEKFSLNLFSWIELSAAMFSIIVAIITGYAAQKKHEKD